MFEVIQRKPKIDAYSPKGRKMGDISGQIELRDVYFSYPARPKELILKGFSLFIPSGKTAALVGRSGSGKSTVISLIERFYDPMTGEVLIDGVDLRKLQLKWIRRKIGLVSQEPVLFGSRSIRENIAYGREGASSEDVIAAAVLANAADFISKLPQGLDTMVGEQGIQLSGGQKQRIAIARAILKSPRILLLDEATSALDGESERIVQGALERAMLNRTVIVVSHRLSTVMNAHFIAVIHRGRIVQKGSHAELLKDRKGLYNQLLRLQDIGKEMKRDKSVCDSLEIGPQSLSAPHRHFLHTTKSQEAMPELPSKSEASDKGPPQVPLSRLARLNSPEIPVLLLGALLAVANGVILPIFGTVLSGIIKTFSEPPQELSKDSKFWALMFVVLGFASFLSHSLSTYFFAVAGCKLIQRVRSMCFEKVVNMDIGWFDEPQHSSGAIGTRLSTDAVLVRRVVGDSLAILAQSTATAVAGLVANEAVGSMRTVSSFCAEKKVVKQYEKKCEAPLKAGIRHGLISGIGLGMSSFFLFFAYAISFYVGALVVHHGKATFHQVFFALSVTAIGISQSNSLAPNTSKAKVSVASIFEILDHRSKIDPSQNCGKRSKHVKGDIQFRHVRFRYPSRPDIKIFRDLCLTIRAGMTVALVGESGSGKSTFISLLQRFYEPDAGRITLDGIEISKLQLKWLRQQMGLVSQEPVLFNDTIRANIAYGKAGNVTEAEIVTAAKLANAHNFISSLQQGYNTLVGERGINLSGGQKQRVAIARAVIRAPKILLLDEATSALDAKCERAVQEALERVMVGQTTVVVSHRLSTIKGADLIAVIRNGVIVEKGRHETLIKIKDGFYATLMAPRNKM
ncbi:ABC transporter B family member 11 [Gossypium arboreum]|uniref:ABC transporter B family member 11 n=1 Tax=Gossypium arboreum TaxID=29729 RepID=A0A0B0NW81_GOSAR|nr:ABC transporter B family member 11 [Gossypium arboreum]